MRRGKSTYKNTYTVTARQRDDVYAILGAWWCQGDVTLISHGAALRLALLLVRA